jgi:hypothetical protein
MSAVTQSVSMDWAAWTGLHSRLAIPVRFVSGFFPLAVLAHHQPPTAAGCGTITTPHLGITAAVQSARVGETIELVGGTYGPASFTNIEGTIKQPVVVQPLGYESMLLEASTALVSTPTPDNAVASSISADESSTTPPRRLSVSTEPFAQSTTPLPLLDHDGKKQQHKTDSSSQSRGSRRIAERQLTSHERRSMARCTIAAPIGVTGGTVERLLTMDHCHHVHIRGLEFHRGDMAIEVFDPYDVKITHSVVDCRLPFRSNAGSDCVVPAATNEVYAQTNKLLRVVFAGDLHPHVRFLGYAVFFVLYVIFALLCLFLTANFSNAKADEWIIRSVVTTAAVGLIIQPATSATLALATFSNAVLFSALNSLASFVPV